VVTVLGRIRESALAGESDADLLRRFNAGSAAEAEAAFALLVRRHGPLVLRTCRATLGDHHAAEDAFQAAFLVLATRARALPAGAGLGPWLFEVARRVAAKARTAAGRRRAHEMRAAAAKPESQCADRPEPDVAAAVLDAVGRLPEKYRAAVLLCDLDGLSYQQAADRLGLSHGAVRNRLARGRERLRAALKRIGITSAAVLTQGAAPTVPRPLVAATARAAVLVASGADGAVPAHVLTLVKGGLTTMFLTKMKSAGLSVAAVGALVAGAFGLSAQPPAPAPMAQRYTATIDYAFPVAGTYSVTLDADPAARIAELAREVKRRQEAGDTRGAKQLLRRLHAATYEWEDALAGDGLAAPKPDAAPAPSKPTRPAPATNIPYAADPHIDRPVPAPQGVPSTLQLGVDGRFPKPATDVETRLNEVERKLDRLLKALEGKGAEPAPKRN
jgi:RNA polymerase sigma factor (sigma-70 family)